MRCNFRDSYACQSSHSSNLSWLRECRFGTGSATSHRGLGHVRADRDEGPVRYRRERGLLAQVLHPPIDQDKPFQSASGYRSSIDAQTDPILDMLPDAFAVNVIETHVAKDLRGEN